MGYVEPMGTWHSNISVFILCLTFSTLPCIACTTCDFQCMLQYLCAAVDMLAWSPNGSVYVMVTGDHIDICAFEVCEDMCQ